MTRSAADVVTEFCAKWAKPDPDELAGYFTEDAVYHNVPMDPVVGRDDIRDFIAGFTSGFDGIEFRVHRQIGEGLSSSGVVMNERTDVMRRRDGGVVPLPVVGVFEIVDGRIATWSDYFDLATATKAFS